MEKSTVQDKETYIIVLGESTSKFHMQLYGYERNTNPKLSALKNELTVFKQVKSSHVHTIEAIKDMLVLKDSSDDFTKYSLIDCFNEAGFSTYWLSNQIYIGENETIVSAIAKRAHKRIFINPLGGNKFDEEILPELSDILKDNENKKVVFIHLMGTHLSYQNRYPNEFDVFKTEEKSLFGDHADSYINHYDNAILYNDYVISEVIDKAKSESGLCAVVYSSDHGDEVYDFRDFHGHSQELLSKYMQSVPFLIWSNKSFKRKRGEVLTNATNNSEMPFTLNNLPHSIQELFGVKSEYYNASRSFFAEKGVKSEESPDEIFHSETLQALPAYASRIWVHRVNSLERLNYVQDKFDGMELDIVYENGVLDVRHPPAKSIHLSLDIYFSNVNNITSHYFWLDLKNLTKQNVKEVIERLNYLRDKYGIKDNLVLETNNARCIPEMRDTGFYTSYYIANLAYLSGDEQKKEIEKIAAEIAMYKLDVISQSVDNYRLMKEYFPYSQKLVWALNLNWNDSTVHDRIKTLLENDTSIKISLVNYETGGWK
ncbi:MAG: phosphoethanolamine transferase [Flavobacteriales bacterium]|nr:phosphoethanolamine transferase [Flavobacteriales bacterium]